MSSFSYANFCKALRFTVKGRDPRQVFWSYVGFTFLYFVVLLLPLIIFFNDIPQPVRLIYICVLLVCYSLALIIGCMTAVRRLHDTSKSGYWILGYIIFTFIAGIVEKIDSPIGYLIGLLHLVFWVVLVVFLCQKSDPSANKYGDV